jgi:pyruvate kinase
MRSAPIRVQSPPVARRTKIVATIGPASDPPERLRALMDAGMDVARVPLAHGSLADALERMARVRRAAAEAGRDIGVLVDLPGPKIRAASFPERGVELVQGSLLTLVPGSERSDAQTVQVDYDPLLRDIRTGDLLTFGDGQVVIEVESVGSDRASARVTVGGELRGRPGLRLPSERVSAATPTDEDLESLAAFVAAGVDMVAVSFVRTAADVRRVGTERHPEGPLVIAKIETGAAVANLPEIIHAADGIMVARGDLGTEFPIEELPHLQKRIIRDCIAGGLPVITATQMLDSMIDHTTPTRAEASDIANAVFDGTSAVMLSAETAVGRYPVECVETMARIAERADDAFDFARWVETVAHLRQHAAQAPREAITDAMTMAACRVATELEAAAIVCISGSGYTVRATARFRPEAPILGLSADPRTVRQLTLSWGVQPLLIAPEWSYEYRVSRAIAAARDAGRVRNGDLVVVLAGLRSDSRATDVLRCLRVGSEGPTQAPRAAD